METNVKPGHKTTEFWLSLASTVIGAVLAAGVLPAESKIAQIVGAGMMVLSSLGYGYNRATIKAADSRRTPRFGDPEAPKPIDAP